MTTITPNLLLSVLNKVKHGSTNYIPNNTQGGQATLPYSSPTELHLVVGTLTYHPEFKQFKPLASSAPGAPYIDMRLSEVKPHSDQRLEFIFLKGRFYENNPRLNGVWGETIDNAQMEEENIKIIKNPEVLLELDYGRKSWSGLRIASTKDSTLKKYARKVVPDWYPRRTLESECDCSTCT